MKPIFTGAEWSFEKIDLIWKEIDKIGKEELKLDYYEPQLEIINSDQMLDAYSSAAMPIMYNHWSFGKSFIKNQNAYKKGMQGLAYEVVINTNPTLAYLMEDNTMTMQALVIAHAVCGHGSFFKTNHLFADGVAADSILDYLKFAKEYISDCEKKHGQKNVQLTLDAAHSLRLYGVDRYNKPRKKNKKELKERRKKWLKYADEQYDPIMPTTMNDVRARMTASSMQLKIDNDFEDNLPELPEENLLYFLQKYSPVLEPWQREILRIVRKVEQYFYPQRQTQLMNEGWACFIHYTIMGMLYDKGLIDDGSYLEFLQSHCAVTYQRPLTPINVYALGFAMMQDIRRMCENPTDEDRQWFPDLVGKDWLSTMKEIIVDYRDESFILQFLSPKVIRDMKLFTCLDNELGRHYTIADVHDDEDVLNIRKALAENYALANRIPHIEVRGVEWKGDRSLSLVFVANDDRRPKYEEMKATLEYIRALWGFQEELIYEDSNGNRLEA